MRISFLCAVALALWAAAARAELASAETPTAAAPSSGVHRFTLDNGMRFIVEPTANRERALVMVAYDRGSRDDPKGFRGLAHLTEHLTFRRSKVFTSYEDLGATEYNGLTFPDETIYYARLPAVSIERAMWIEAERMAFVIEGLTEEDVKHEQKIVDREHGQRLHGTSTLDLLNDKLYPPDHPYRQMGDVMKDVERVRLEHVQWYAQDVYQPTNATMVVMGAVDPAKVEDWAHRYFDQVRAARAPKPRVQPAPLAQPATACRIASKHVFFDEAMYVTWIGPPRYGEEAARLEVVMALLDGPQTARMAEELTQSGGPASSVSIGMAPLELGGRIALRLEARRDEKTERILAIIDEHVRALAKGDFTDRALRGAKKYVSDARRDAARDALTRALERRHTEQDLLQRDLDLYARMTADDVKRLAAHWLDPRRRVVLRLDQTGHLVNREHCEPAEGGK